MITQTPKRRPPWKYFGFAFVACGLLAFFFFVPDLVARRMNTVHQAGPYVASDRATSLHQRLFTADLHADTLLWNRNPAVRGRYGHVDLPRLLESRFGLQVFSAVTKTPRGLNFESNDGSTDNITLLTIAQRWPPRTWTSLTERARYQAQRLHQLANESEGQFVIVKSGEDLTAYLKRRERNSNVTAGLLAIEGMHALDAELENLRRLYAAGYRMMGLTHFFDNAIGGSAHGVEKGGLTEFGRHAINEMERLGIIVDLAHASPTLSAEVLAMASRPLVVSHSGVKGTCDRTRNLSDEQLLAIASNGGLVGIAYFDEAICGTDVSSIIAAIRYTSDLIGVEHVALGSDFDGAVSVPFDVTGLPLLTQGLINAGYSEEDIAAIMGRNIISLLQRTLPPR